MGTKASGKKVWEAVWEKKRTLEGLIETVEREETRIRNILRYIPKGKVLEAGCGDGKYVFYLSHLDYDMTGIDFVDKVIQRNQVLAARWKGPVQPKFHVMDVCDLNYPSGHFDGYLSMGVIEHFDDPKTPLAEAYRVLKRSGRIFVTVPNRLSPWHFTRGILAKAKPGAVPWQKEYTVSELAGFATSVGFSTVASFNCNVRDAFRLAFMLEARKLGVFINPLYYLRRCFYGLANRLEESYPIFGYHSVFVGSK